MKVYILAGISVIPSPLCTRLDVAGQKPNSRVGYLFSGSISLVVYLILRRLQCLLQNKLHFQPETKTFFFVSGNAFLFQQLFVKSFQRWCLPNLKRMESKQNIFC